METKSDGGSAFPRYGNNVWGEPCTQDAGMALRDYFAAKALNAILAQPEDGIAARNPDHKFSDGTPVAQWWAKSAYQIADAMLAERAK